jgi:hypothetical protein
MPYVTRRNFAAEQEEAVVALVANVDGGYAYSPGLRFASNGVIALEGMAIDQGLFSEPLPFDSGFAAIRTHLDASGLPAASLCGVELRLPATLTLEAFVEFNNRYLAELDGWNLLRDGTSPLARTNVSPFGEGAPAEPTVIAFSYTAPDVSSMQTYVISGIAELPLGSSYPEGIVRRGETSRDAMQQKVECVTEAVRAHIESLGTEWRRRDVVNLYSAHPMAVLLTDDMLFESDRTPAYGVCWHRAAPPVSELELEIDVRRYRNVLSVTDAAPIEG